jgi:hypothetical protein
MDKIEEPHEKQWRKLFEIYTNLSGSKEDIYDRRAQSCQRLLSQYC